MNRVPRALATLAILWGAACSGTIGEPGKNENPGGGEHQPGDPGGSPSDPGGGTPGTPGGPSGGNNGNGMSGGGAPTAPAEPGAAPLRRLTRREYANTVRDLLGVEAMGGRLSVDQDNAGFTIGGPVSTATDAGRVLDSASELAAAAASKLTGLLPCPNVAPAGEEACAKDFITQFGRRAFRRPLDADEVADLLAVYTKSRAPDVGYAFPDAIRAVVTAMLSSPFFLYRAELGAQKGIKDGASVRFNGWEMASRLSYALWATMPDDALFAEAEGGRLQSATQIEAQARRMLKDPRTRETLHDFHMQWLGVEDLVGEDKDPKFKEFTPELAQAMLAETAAFVDDLMVGPQASGSFAKFFTSVNTKVDPTLAKIYGVTATGTGPQAVTLNDKERAGILTQASVLTMHADAAESHPVRRGAMLLRRVFCIDIPPPPNMDVGQAKPPAPGLTTRERYAEHAKQACASCHRMTDPMGFAMEHYDAIGQYRTQDMGKDVDASGELQLESGKISFKDAVDLAKQLPQIQEAQQCMATQWLRYMTRRNEFTGDQASLQAARATLGGANGDLREMLVSLIKSRAFTHRSPNAGEVLQ
jgi:hypothetical protein